MSKQRIAKFIARSGYCSRRKAEDYIAKKSVSVNGETIGTPATFVDESDQITINGKAIQKPEATMIWCYNKPGGLITSHNDPQKRPTIFEQLSFLGKKHLISVGRLDLNTEGLLLLTNDGGVARYLELPSTNWKRIYRVRVHGKLDHKKLESLKKGITHNGVHYGQIDCKIEKEGPTNSWLQMAIYEGKNREIKNICEALNLKVNRLIRVSYGPFQLGKLEKGQCKPVNQKRIDEILQKMKKSSN